MGATQGIDDSICRNAQTTTVSLLQDWLTRRQFAALLGKSERTVQRWEAARTCPARVKVGNTVLYRAEAIREWLAANEQRPVARRR